MALAWTPLRLKMDEEEREREESWGASRAATRTPSSRPASHKSARSTRSKQSSRTTEQTPLLSQQDRDDRPDNEETPAETSLRRSLSGSSVKSDSERVPLWRKRWPSILALVILCVVFIIIMLGFLAKESIEEYSMQAADFKPTRLTMQGLTEHGADVQVEGDFKMDASKVKKQSVRNLGRFGTWIAREAETGAFDADVYLPEYGDVLIGTAKIPGIKVNIRNGHTTHVSFVANVQPGEPDGIRNVANDWIDGRLGQIRLRGRASVPVKSGLINVGRQLVEHSMVLQGGDIPSLPHYNITKLNLGEAKHGQKGLGADATIVVHNDFPVQITLPPVAVDVGIEGCSATDKHIMVGTARTGELKVNPESDVKVEVTGNVDKLSDPLTQVCPNSAKSPLDAFLGDYMKGEDATIYISCCKFPDPATPEWARDLLKDITVPVPFAGKSMGNLIRNFSLADMHFSLPNPFAEPGTPEAAPKISGIVNVDIGLPNEMNFPIDVNQVKADADIYYHKKKLGKMNLEKWQKTNSTRIEGKGSEGPTLLVQSVIKNAPIEILDDDLFSEVVQALLFGGKSIMMDLKAAVSVGVDTPMGKLAVRGIPAQGVVPVKPIRGGKDTKPGNGNDKNNGSGLNIKVGNLAIVDTSPTSLTINAMVNFTNPTNYSATIPYFNINVLANGSHIGSATIENMEVLPGNNTNKLASLLWDPYTFGGDKGKKIGAELLSQYISGFNTTITVQAHEKSVPALPYIGRLLSHFPIERPMPHMSTPKKPSDGDDDDDPEDDGKSHFIRGTTMHLISSTAVFTLASPFRSTTLYITDMNATAYYEGHIAGKILYDLPFAVPPGLSESPRLPVDWSFGSLGYEAIKRALGGQLKLSAFANVGVRIGEWRESVWFKGGKIGANVRL
ncbi:hypothetical protein A1F97_09756 [Pyrenophora tritici-repentis]|uniref:Uncharacterized protein n=3 Tax=Pyrenophora tritici-repentis TaxID=45151 RepID=A0A2W1G3A0_9PLEO|nr:hypothetical protein Ptr86124_010440 [Pyrenophora tritici-repentis]KAI1669837.1 hypothetical protein L13192_05353 [Pyrenophora tritici-repentis]KAI1681424.1 hypothetical protein KJE20_08295 [Pyrenophora tritici-repentis]PZD27961.1 hypothetical protein A1F96_06279 [Pyrenophora tritici-repentis]PZD31820.1 hypothetical protein A1F97_09756 [Pyrenophora tritici-repentis]